MQVPVQTGVKLLAGSFATSFPINLEHRILDSGVSQGQLVSARGAVSISSGPGISRGGVYWNGTQYRAMGTKLVSVDTGGTVTELGEIGGSSLVEFDYSFDRLGVVSDGRLFYWDGASLTEVTDPDLGEAKDLGWLDGYFITTDGESIIVTELLDPTQIDALKYGSAESDPDPVTGIETFNEELYVLNRHTIQVFQNDGSTGFPFRNVRGALVEFGCIGPAAKCQIAGTMAFAGGGREEPIGVYLYTGGDAQRISTREIDDLLAGVDHELIELEARKFGEDEHLVVHTPDVSATLKIRTAGQSQEALWTILHSGRFGPYRLRHAVWDGSRHFVGDLNSPAIGVLSIDDVSHFGERAEWRFDIGLLYNEGRALLIQEIEIVGQFPYDLESSVFLSITRDGALWSNEVARQLTGRRAERCIWRPNVRMPAMSGARFRGHEKVAIARSDVSGEALAA